MSSNLLLSVKDASVRFGSKVIFDALSFNIHDGNKICLVGKNGTGKTTLMNIITGALELGTGEGERWVLQGTTIGYLQQDIIPKPGQAVYDFVFEQLKKDHQDEANAYKVEMVLHPLELKIDDKMDMLSGGQLRRAALARALVESPDILLLDEPTNHLDLDIIEWLEKYLKSYRGALVCVSHDRAFLSAVSDKIFWLDRGRLRVAPKGFAHFDDWSTELLEQEERELKNRANILAIEVEWASRGVKARRKRNIGRVEKMREAREKLKQDKSAFKRMMSKIELDPLDFEGSSKIVAEFFKVDKTLTDGERQTQILNKFSMRIMRGDRIGILGKNGSGKTSFLRLLVGELAPDMGKVKLAKDMRFSYFDQRRQDLDYSATLQMTLCPQGGDHINVMGKTRHVCGYLKDFLFDPQLIGQTVGTLSGGQKNRLLLAKILANPGSFLILDEPTNDLDMDTLDMLEEILSQYQGTLIVVSHDRDFLDQTVTKTLVFEGNGVIEGYIGGYSDYLAAKAEKEGKPAKKKPEVSTKETKPDTTVSPPPPAKKLTYKIQYELEKLPEKIKALEAEIETLEALLADAGLYMREPDVFDRSSRHLIRARNELNVAELRWLELDEMQDAIKEQT